VQETIELRQKQLSAKDLQFLEIALQVVLR
jgi:hypothetical protein